MGYNAEFLYELHDSTGGTCHICTKRIAFSNYGDPYGRGGWQVDHVHPRALGGKDDPSNLAPACIPCNQAKGRETRALVRDSGGQAAVVRRSVRDGEIITSTQRRKTVEMKRTADGYIRTEVLQQIKVKRFRRP